MKLLERLLLCVALAILPAAVQAAGAFPSHAIRLIVPFPAGGPSDLFGRALAAEMAKDFGQPVVVENRSGVGGVLGVDVALKSAADGYTLALNSASTLAIAPFSLKHLPYDVKKDIALITVVVRVPEVLVVHPSLPVSNLAEFIAYAKANPGKINFGSAGAGSITHLAGELLKAQAHLDLVHVPYKGAAPAVADLLGGRVQMVILDVPVVLPHIRSGKLKAIAVTSAKRALSLPDVPTMAEGGLPKVNSDNWYGLIAPAGTPKAVLKHIHAVAVKALHSEEIARQYAKVSAVPFPTTPAGYAKFLAAEQAKWSKVVNAIGFKQ